MKSQTSCGNGKARTRIASMWWPLASSVHVYLAAVLVDRGADLADRGLEHAVRGRIGDHQRGQVVGVLRGLGA